WIKSSLTPQEIRDRLMASDSEFQKRMVEYLEGVHCGEFLSSTSQEVKDRLDFLVVDETLPTAVETMAVPPPVCTSDNGCVTNGDTCKECTSWDDHFKNTTNELLFRCNTHRCSGNKTDTTSLRRESSNDNKYQPVVGCRSNKWGKCKARFPRPTYTHTSLDPTTGALLMKKGEPLLNFFTDLITYLFRCNTDVTSLLSGTALKAVIAYISDYISKPSLRTYIVFDTIKSVFEKNVLLFSGTLERGEKARKIMTQIVNSLTSKMEIGAPMASLYLLGNPDHYTSHQFVPVYWKSYVSEVRRSFAKDSEELVEEDGNIVLKRIAGSVVGTSPVFDYIYRPTAFEDMSLYDWTRLYEKKRIPSTKASDDADTTSTQRKSHKYSDYLLFLEEHPLHSTHHVRILLNGEGKVPNFVGGSLPRHDKGDLDYYSCTMLTLFAPWRSGTDLKSQAVSWISQFQAYDFSIRQREIMKFFNVRYECLDARDDYSAQMREDDSNHALSEWVTDKFPAEEEDTWVDKDTVFPPFEIDSVVDDTHIGKRTSKWNYDKAVIEQALHSSGWLLPSLSAVELAALDPIEVDNSIRASQWKSRVKARRNEVLEERAASIAQRPSRHSTMQKGTFVNNRPNEVCIVNNTFLQKSFKPQLREDGILIDKVVGNFSLNEEQERAFRIISNHAT
ncbi:hypothetical protein BJ138DRAFT_967204, partial [Hygrophoropsis aurantiaca]